MEYKYLKDRGALAEGKSAAPESMTIAGFTPRLSASSQLTTQDVNHILRRIWPEIATLIPESIARENTICAIEDDGETVTVAATKTFDIALADKLRFLLNRDIRFVHGSETEIKSAIDRNYGLAETESVDSMICEFTDTQIDVTDLDLARGSALLSAGPIDFKKGAAARNSLSAYSGLDTTTPLGGHTMFSYVVEEGNRVLMRRPDGRVEILIGPLKVNRFRKIFRPMQHYVAHPGEFLIVRYRDGRQEHIPGPTELWLDPRVHQEIAREEALQIAAREAVVVYSRPEEGSEQISRRIVYGPALFVPEPGEWLHTFSWHGSKGGSQGVEKTANSLVFQKLWLMPDQMYHDIRDVRTADDAVLTLRLMIFFELLDIEKMLETTHDPIGDLINAATSDVVGFTGQHDFESFKQNTNLLNELEAYKQLTNRANQCGYRINKVVYRGYGAPESLQQMHNQAIEARTRLQLERANEQQAQDLENYKLDCQLARASKRRSEQTAEVEHDLTMTQKKQEADRQEKTARHEQILQQRLREREQEFEMRSRQHHQEREQLDALRNLGVDLTAYLTQSRADRVIELRGGGVGTHLHLDQITGDNDPTKRGGQPQNGS
jgi:hypothetical protein